MDKLKNHEEQIGDYRDKDGFSAHFYKTQDNSWTVSIVSDEIQTELMHSQSGSFSETIYVYLPVVDFVIKNNLDPVFLSIGLGVGYIEIMLFAYLLNKNISDEYLSKLFIFSFEKEEKLIQFFTAFFLDKSLPKSFHACYSSILQLNSEYFSVDKNELKLFIREFILKNNFVINNKFTSETQLTKPASGIFFDAFSANSSPDLWHESYIDNILSQENCASSSAFATYASKSMLKRKLKENHFNLLKKKGFAGKRECVFASRMC
ncbi:MnmC family methyltransferase [Fluviispira vulneris]|uniref:MnmC family methyltransferase n=1 Tax=Fluviispira vulneris TaxID=2763012 RepID=UPI0016480BF6|nr:MnmC family methyltransferase [Fluviispira vulneris]